MSVIEFIYVFKKVGLPIIVTSNKPHLFFLIDTGATHNGRFSFVAKALNLSSDLQVEAINISGIEGYEKKTPGLTFTLYLDDKEILSEFYILDANEAIRKIQEETSIQIHGIFGVPYLDEYSCIVDFNEQLLKFKI